MKKVKIIKKIIVNSLLGFPIGITLLMINYASIFLIAGESTYVSEISQLQNVATLLLQLVIIGFAYYLFFVNINIISHLNDTKFSSDQYLVEHPYKSILNLLLIIIISIFILVLLEFSVFTDNLITVNFISFIIVFILYGIYLCIKTTIENNIIKKINQKLKERTN